MKYIKCPKCGCEYHPSEIFIPSYLTGKPTEIIKNEKGKIELVLGENADMLEEYCCDKCNTTFSIEAEIEYKVSKVSNPFDEDYTTTIYDDRVELE